MFGERLINALLYYGYTPEQYITIKKDIHIQNIKMLRLLMWWLSACFLFTFVLSMFITGLFAIRNTYLTFFFISVFLTISLHRVDINNCVLGSVLTWLCILTVFAAAGIIGLVYSTDEIDVVFMITLFAVTSLIIERPVVSLVMLLGAATIFSSLSFQVKPQTIFETDLVDAITFAPLGFVFGYSVNRIRLQSLYLKRNLEHEVLKQTHMIENMSLGMIKSLAATIDEKDKYTTNHSKNVAQISVKLAEKLGWSEKELRELKTAAELHDIGNTGVPDTLLKKPGKLTQSEYDIIKAHTLQGEKLLTTLVSLPSAREVALYHHERYDGTGYPEGLKGDEIPVSARIVAVAEAYDAMSNDRIYRRALSKEMIREELQKGRGTQFDPAILDQLLELLERDAPFAV